MPGIRNLASLPRESEDKDLTAEPTTGMGSSFVYVLLSLGNE